MGGDEEEGPEAADVVAFVDEAGPRGYLRDLGPATDDGVSVLCALPIPAENVDEMREAVRPAYDTFCAAAPPGSKLHITEAFKLGNEEWGAIADEFRNGLFEFMLRTQCRVVYAARRLGVARNTFEMNEAQRRSLAEERDARGPSNIVRPGADRPSDEQVDDQLMQDLALLMDLFMETEGKKLADFHFDEITDTAAQRFGRLVHDLSQVGDRTVITKYRNLSSGQNFTRSFRIATQCTSDPEFHLAIRYIGKITKIGKSDPLIFATDVVANSLWRHLRRLDPTADLNDSSALVGWPLASIVFGEIRPGASLMDRI